MESFEVASNKRSVGDKSLFMFQLAISGLYCVVEIGVHSTGRKRIFVSAEDGVFIFGQL